MLIKAALTTNVLVLLVWLWIVCVGMSVWLMVSFVSASAVCATINTTEKSTKTETEHTNNTHTCVYEPVQGNRTLLQKIKSKHRSFLSPKRAHTCTLNVCHIQSPIHSPFYPPLYPSFGRFCIFHTQFLHCDHSAESLMWCGCGQSGCFRRGLWWVKDSGQSSFHRGVSDKPNKHKWQKQNEE